MPRKPQDQHHAARIARRLGDRVRGLRRSSQLTQEQVSDKVGLTPEAYARIERGHSLPSFPTLLRICEALGTTPDALLMEMREDLASWIDDSDAATPEAPATGAAREELAALVYDLHHLGRMDPRLVRDVARLVRSMREVVAKATPKPGAQAAPP